MAFTLWSRAAEIQQNEDVIHAYLGGDDDEA